MKILWISNADVSDARISSTGTWVVAMYETLLNTYADIDIINLLPSSSVKFPMEFTNEDVLQYKIPTIDNISKKEVDQVIKFIKELDVDLVHIWGTENGWAFFITTESVSLPVLLDIQGLMSTVQENYLGGLDPLTLLKNLTIRDVLRYKTSLFNLNQFSELSRKEDHIIKYAKYIAYPSEWVRSFLLLRNPQANLYKTHLLLRKEFYNSGGWDKVKAYKSMSIVAVAAFNYPLKGGHVLLKSLAILKQRYPDIELRIVGRTPSKLRSTSYDKYIKKEIKRLNLTSNVKWFGPLDSYHLVDLLTSSTLYVCPSYVESYSLATAEATMLGIPVITAHAGALPEFLPSGTLSFPIGDYNQLAAKIDYLFNNPDIAYRISEDEKRVAIIRHDRLYASQCLMAVYMEILSRNKCNNG